MPSPGAVFTTFNGRLSRRISSWYFGDGALLLNQVYSNSARVTQRITPLDPVVNRPLTREQSGGSVGVRVGRVISPRTFTGSGLQSHAAITAGVFMRF